MAEITYSERAQEDFSRIIEFLLDTAPESASQVVATIASAVTILESHPLIGERVRGDIRKLVISQHSARYLALYRFNAATGVVRILRIRHQREDWQ